MRRSRRYQSCWTGEERGKQAHIILNQHKNQHRAEITFNFLDHQLVGEHVDSDQFTAINMAH